jgi:hypothetical protein
MYNIDYDDIGFFNRKIKKEDDDDDEESKCFI